MASAPPTVRCLAELFPHEFRILKVQIVHIDEDFDEEREYRYELAKARTRGRDASACTFVRESELPADEVKLLRFLAEDKINEDHRFMEHWFPSHDSEMQALRLQHKSPYVARNDFAKHITQAQRNKRKQSSAATKAAKAAKDTALALPSPSPPSRLELVQGLERRAYEKRKAQAPIPRPPPVLVPPGAMSTAAAAGTVPMPPKKRMQPPPGFKCRPPAVTEADKVRLGVERPSHLAGGVREEAKNRLLPPAAPGFEIRLAQLAAGDLVWALPDGVDVEWKQAVVTEVSCSAPVVSVEWAAAAVLSDGKKIAQIPATRERLRWTELHGLPPPLPPLPAPVVAKAEVAEEAEEDEGEVEVEVEVEVEDDDVEDEAEESESDDDEIPLRAARRPIAGPSASTA